MGARGVFAVFAAAPILLLVPILTVTDAGIEAIEAESSAREARRRMTSAQT